MPHAICFTKLILICSDNNFFHNYMRPRKLPTEMASQTVFRKQRSQILNSKYLVSHESTSFSGQFNNSIDQLSSISLRDCFEELNAHIAQHRPLKPLYVIQIKKYLTQLKRTSGENYDPTENKRVSKESNADDRFLIRSPYIVNRSIKKFKTNDIENETNQQLRKTLKRRKINCESIETQNFNRYKPQLHQNQAKVIKAAAELKQQCATLSKSIASMKEYFIAQIQGLKTYFRSEHEKIIHFFSSSLQNYVLIMKRQHSRRQSELRQAMRILEEKIERGKQRQKCLEGYLKQRETQLVTAWTAFSLQPR